MTGPTDGPSLNPVIRASRWTATAMIRVYQLFITASFAGHGWRPGALPDAIRSAPADTTLFPDPPDCGMRRERTICRPPARRLTFDIPV